MSPPHATHPHIRIRRSFSSFLSSCSLAAAPRVPPLSPHVRPSSSHAHTHARIFYFDFERRLPRHSISRRVRTKAQHPSTVAVMHSSNFAALATLRTPIMTCMYNLTHAFLSIPNHHLFFPSQARTHVRGFASRHTGEPSLTMSIQRS
jgi:hypothetical protein